MPCGVTWAEGFMSTVEHHSEPLSTIQPQVTANKPTSSLGTEHHWTCMPGISHRRGRYCRLLMFAGSTLARCIMYDGCLSTAPLQSCVSIGAACHSCYAVCGLPA